MSTSPTTLATEDAQSTALDETVMGSAPVRARAELRPLARGSMVGRYVVLDTLGRGAMGIVYAAYDPELDRKIALKLLLPGRDSGASARLRLQREAQAIARLSHPNVVAVHDVGTVDEQVFIAMEFVDGCDLTRWLARGDRTQAEILDCFAQVGQGLAAAHAAGLVHRDLKPDNVLVGNDGRARVVDFGLVRQADSSASISHSPDDSGLLEISQRHAKAVDPPRLTDAGTMMGTPAYMSPEQFMGHPGDPRSDQFSFCVSLYEGLYGERPFAGDSSVELSYSVTQGQIRSPPPQRNVSGRLRRVLLRGLASDPDARYPSMETLLAALRKAGAPRRRGWIAVGIVVLGVAGTIAWWRGAVDEESSCDRVGTWVDAMWDPERKASIAGAFEATGRTYAKSTWDRVEERLDRRLARWVEIQREVCEDNLGSEAAAVAKDPRQRCLEQRLAETSDLLAVFERAGDQTLVQAVQLVNAQSSVEDCTRFDVVDLYPTPSEPQLQARVDQLRSDLRRWTLQVHGGHTKQADAAFEDLIERVEAADYAPITAELLRYRSTRVHAQGDLETAVELDNRAFEVALACHHDITAFEASTDLLFIHGVELRDFDTGLLWARRADALWQHLGGDKKRRIHLLNGWASMNAVAENEARAQELYDEVVTLARGLDNPLGLATVLNNIGAFHGNKRPELALTYLEEAAQLNADVLGPEHPSSLRTQANLGIIAIVDGRYDDGLEVLEALLPRQEAMQGTLNTDVGNTVEAMASAYDHLERDQEALAARHRAIEIRAALAGPMGRPTLRARLNLARTLRRSGDVSAAHELMTTLQQQLRSMPEPDVGLQIDVSTNLAHTAQRLGQAASDDERTRYLERAHGHLVEAGELCRAHPACTAQMQSNIDVALASVLLRLGDGAQARRLLEELVARPDPEISAIARLDARFGVARLSVDDDREASLDDARRILARARAEAGSDADELVEEIESWLAEQEELRDAG